MPDSEIFETTDWEYERLKNRLREVAYLNKGITISLKDERDSRKRNETFCYEGGLAEFVENYNRSRNTIFDQPLYVDKSVKRAKSKSRFNLTTVIPKWYTRTPTT